MESITRTIQRKSVSFFSLDFALFLIVVAIHLYPGHGLRNPWLLSDEFCYLSTAAWAGGRDWSRVVTGSTYYSFGSTALLIPFFKYGFPADFIYQVALVMNGLLGGTIFLSAHYCGRRLVEKANVSSTTVSLAAFAAALYPSNLAYSHVALAETALTAAYWGSVAASFHMTNWARSRTAPALFGAIIGSIWMIHRRSVAIIFAATLVVFVARQLGYFKRRTFITYILSLGIVLASALILDTYFVQNLWRGNLVPFQSQKYNLHAAFFGGIRSFLGQIFYLGVATNLLALIGFLIGVHLSSIWLFKRMQGGALQDPQKMMAILYATTAGLFAFGLSVFIMIPGHRFDHVVYGRYNEALIGPLVLLALLAMSRKIQTRMKPEFYAISAALALILTTVLFYFQAQDYLDQKLGYFTTIIGLFPYRTEQWTIKVLPVLVQSLILSAIILALIRRLPRAGLVAISAIWGMIGFYAITNQFVPASKTRRDPGHITKWLRNHGVDKGVCFLQHSRSDFHHQLYQWWLDDDSRLVMKGDASLMNDCRYLLVHTSKLSKIPRQSALVAADPEWSYSLWAYSKREKARLEKDGVRFLDPSNILAVGSKPGLLPVDEYRSTLTITGGDRIVVRSGTLDSLRRRLKIGDSIRIRVKHEGKSITWPSTVRVGARWYKREHIEGPGLAEERADLPALRPGEQAEVELHLRCPDQRHLPPGDYALVIGLVHEEITWFSAQGDKDLVLPVVIKP